MRSGSAPIVFMLLIIAAPANGREKLNAVERYRVTQKGGGLGIDIDETVSVSAILNHANKQHWIAELLRRDHNWCATRERGRCLPGDKVQHKWIDGNACPFLVSALEELAIVKVTGFTPPDRSAVTLVTDTPLVTVSGTPDIAGDGAHLTVSEYTGPMVDWWHRSASRLASCWTDTLRIGGQQIDPMLLTK